MGAVTAVQARGTHRLAQESAEGASRAVETPSADRAAERKPARLALTARLATAEAEAARLRTLVEEWRELLHQDAEQIASWKAAHAGLCAEVLALRAQVPAATTLASAQRAHAERILRVCGGCVSEAARLLGISRSTLRRMQRRWARAEARRQEHEVEQAASGDARHVERSREVAP